MSERQSIEQRRSASARSLVVLALRDTHGGRMNQKPRPVSIGALGAFEELRERGNDIGTQIVRYDDWNREQEPDAVLWDLASFAVLPRDLRKVSLSRRVGFCLESPLVAHRAYHRLARISEEVAHLVLFAGAAALVPSSSRAEFHTLYWPNDELPTDRDEESRARRFLVMVASNKRSYRGWEGFGVRNPYTAARILAARTLSSSYRLRGQWHVPDLYKLRLEAIAHFARAEDFHLYGVGWDKPVQGERVNRPRIRRCYRGAVADKLSVLQNFRFCLCFENTIFPGYVTEKIFDCFAAGTVPVYVGAPDVSRYIPADCYIDGTAFTTFAELETYLRSLGPADVQGLLSATARFASSDAAEKFRSRYFVDRVLSLLVACSRSRSPR